VSIVNSADLAPGRRTEDGRDRARLALGADKGEVVHAGSFCGDRRPSIQISPLAHSYEMCILYNTNTR